MNDPDHAGAGPVTFRYTVQDFIDAQRLGRVPTRRQWTVLALAGSGFLVFDAVHRGAGDALLRFAPVLLAGLALGALVVWLVVIPWQARRTHARQPLAGLDVEITLLAQGLRIRSPRGESTLLWRDLVRWRPGRRTTLLYLSPCLSLPVPSRLETMGFPVADLRARLRRELGAPAR